MPKVSVIIPVYNVEKYLRQCLDSVVNQTLKDIEIICVDDGSTDGSLAILKEYAAKDDRFIILEQSNQGAGAARNKGLEIAQGEYLSFLDSDDFFELGMLEKVYNYSKQNSTDITMFNCFLYDEALNTDKSVSWTFKKDILKGKNIFNVHDVPNKIFDLSNCWVWNCLYDRNYVNRSNLKFQVLRYQNDVYFSCISKVMAEKIGYLDEKLIHYRVARVNVEHLTSAQNIQTYPLEMCKCLLAIYNKLNELKLFNAVKYSYFNIAVNGLYWVYRNLVLTDSYDEFKKCLMNELSPIFSIKLDISKIDYPKRYKLISNISNNKIPNIIHYCWFGNNKKNLLVKKCISSWKKYLPDYEIIEWRDKDLQNINNDYVREAISCEKWAFVSDFVRLYAVYNYGGIYLDSDNEVFKSFDKFLHLDFFTGYELYKNRLHPFTAVFGAKRHNKIVEDLLAEYNDIHFIENGKMNLKTNTKRVSEYFAKKYNVIPPYINDKKVNLEEKSIIFPCTVFCEYSRGKSYAVHHFNASWHDIQEKRKNNILTNIFSIQNIGVHKVICILGVKLKIKSKKLVERKRYKDLDKKIKKLSKELKTVKELINAQQ